MARQNINVNTGIREFEAYMDFSGGLNIETSNERLNDNEFTQMQNVDLNSRGSVKKRTGRDLIPTTFINGDQILNPSTAQGVFFFYRKNQENPDMVIAAGGKLFVKKYSQVIGLYFDNAELLNISGMALGFNPLIKNIEGVQYYDKLYVATGTDIVVVSADINGAYSAQVIIPYEPNTNELKYIGTNALLLDGSNGVIAMKDTINSSLNNVNQFSVKGIAFAEEGTGKTLINAQTKERFVIKTYVIENPAGLTIPPGETYSKTYNFYYKKVQSERFETRTYTAVATVTNPQTQIAVGTTAVVTLPTGSSYDINTSSMEVSLKGLPLVTGVTFEETSNTTVTVTPTNPIVAGDKVTIKFIPSWWSGNSQYGSFVQSGTNANTFVFRPLEVGFYDFKVEVTFAISNTPTQSSKKEYIYQGLQSKAFREDGDVLEQITAGARKCNRIRLYWDRLMLFGDPDEPTQLYFSDINNPEYFPQVNCLRFDTGKQEPITSVVRLNDYLVVFSKSLIHVLTGKTKDEFSINLINDSVGCIAPRSAVVTGNVVTFLSDEGVFFLRPSTFKLDQLNVKRVDTKIKNEILKKENACALAFDSQYWLCYPDEKKIYRFYYEKDVWVKDVSENLDIVQFLQEGNTIYNFTNRLKIYKQNENIYTDAGLLYDMIVESKYFDLSKSFNFKKLRRLYVLGRCYDLYDVNFYTSVFADNTIVLDPETGYATVTPTGIATWVTVITPNINFEHGTTFGFPTGSPPTYTPATTWQLGFDELGHKYLSVQKTRVRGKCRRVKVLFVNSQDKEVELFGFGLEFKLKKP
jgi:hypothetical protein